MSHGPALTFDALGLLARGLAGVDMAVQPLATVPGSANRLPLDALAPPAPAVLAPQRPPLPPGRPPRTPRPTHPPPPLPPAVPAPKRRLLPEGSDARLRRAMVAHAAAHLRHSAPARPARPLGPMGIALASAIEDAR